MCIRKINSEQDIKRIKDIWRKHCGSNKEQIWQTVVREIKCSKNDTYVNIKNNKIVAFIIIRSEKTEKTDKYRNYIWELFADPIGKGYGSELIQEMQNREFLCLHVKKTNSVAINAYIKNKFIIVNEHPRGDKWYMKWPDK